MKKIAAQKAERVSRSARRWLESLLGRKLDADEEITVSVARPAKLTRDDDGPTCYDIARRGRLIGIVKNAPKDLSTHKKHFRGFGGQ